MSKKFIGGLVLGLAVPAVAGGVCFGTPSIRNKIFKQNNNNSTSLESRIDDLTKENAGLQEDNVTLEGRINTLETNLATANATIQSKDTQIAELNTQISTLESEKQSISDELARTKELLGDDVNYAELVVSLQTQLTDKENELATVTAERDQLVLDKTALETQVAELTAELNQVKEELSNYKSLGEIDKLKVSNFNGTWYKNGTFEDYYTISDGVVTRGADTDKGLLNNIYNQMYLMMNTTGGEAVTLSDDGNYFTTADGVKYSKFYINTVQSVTPSYTFAGEYTHDTTVVNLKADNTCTISIDGTIYNGAYLVSTIEKNIGGNITRFNSVTATYQINDTAVVKEYSNTTSNANVLVNVTDNYSMDKTSGFDSLLPYSSSSSYTPPTSNALKVVLELSRPIYFKSTSSFYYKISGNYSYNSNFNVNGTSYTSSNLSSGRSFSCLYAKSTGYYKFVTFYITLNDCSKNNTSIQLEEYDSKIVDVEYIGDAVNLKKNFPLHGDFLEVYNRKNNIYSVDCNPVTSYTDGTYTNNDMTVTLSDTTATIGDVTATSMTTSAITDGTDIYQTVTINYTVDSTAHTLIMDFKNSTLLTSKLDNTDVVLNKN